MVDYQSHPAADLFPLMAGADLEDFIQDIEERGQLEPITIHHGLILDGRNRYAACCQLRREPLIETRDDIEDPVSWVISKNLKRRHLSASQRAAIAKDALPLYQAQAKERQRAGTAASHTARVAGKSADLVPTNSWEPNRHHGEAVAQAAKAVGVGSSIVAEMKAIDRDAPDLGAQVRAGTLTVNAAKKVRRDRKERATDTMPPLPAPMPIPKRRAAPTASTRHADLDVVMTIFTAIRRQIIDGADARQIADHMNGREEAIVYAASRDLTEWVSKVRFYRADRMEATAEGD